VGSTNNDDQDSDDQDYFNGPTVALPRACSALRGKDSIAVYSKLRHLRECWYMALEV